MSAWADVAISTLLRVGVIVSILVIATGVVVTFAHHPDYLTSPHSLGALTAPGEQYPNTLFSVLDGVRHGSGQAIVMAGLLLLIATPLARVALSIGLFFLENDRMYVGITTAVLLILLIGFAIGLEGG